MGKAMPASHHEAGRPAELRAYLTEDWQRWIGEYPELGTGFGIPGCNDRWTDDSTEGVSRRRAHLTESHARLLGLDQNQLSPVDRLNFDLYRGLLETAEVGARIGYDPLPFDLGEPHDLRMPMNQLEGIHITATDMMDMAPRERVADFEDRLTRLRSLHRAIRDQQNLLEAGRRAGFTPPKISVLGLPDQVQNLLNPDPMGSALLAPFGELPTRFGPSETSRLRSEARAAYADEVAPALTSLRDYLVNQYLPECREEVGASALAGGPATYAYLVRRMTTTALTPEQIHEIGLREVRRVRSEMEAIKVSSGFSGTFEQFTSFLATDPRFFWSRGEDLVDGYRVLGKTTDPQLGRLFGRLPRLPYGVMAVPSYRERTSPAAYYMSGAPATGRAGYFYANTYDVGSRRRWQMEALSLHEAVPGHHLQIALAQELEHLPEFRRWSGPTAFIEGWGLYAESLGEELGFYTDPYSKYGQLVFDAWRSTRLVVDTGMHAMGWTREQAIQFFRESTGMDDPSIVVEVDRYIVWPGQALAYKMGQLKIREMRTLGETRLGERFDVRAFHDLVLGEGALPLDQLELRVRSWVDARAAT
ncbi:MAG: DUF885 domain-containing protein [Thermoplasmata archaeon]|nr:DUF885 domain-containing protein [Thermoplasmata archaeon]